MSLNPTRTLTRLCAATGGIAVILTAGAFPAAAADGDIEVINTETVQAYTDATGEVQGDPKLYEQLALTGEGSVELANPVETSGLRNLNGFSGLSVEDGDQMVDVTVDGQNDLRSVSSYDEDLPLDISVDYVLDGEQISPEDLVGESGDLEVTYTVQNVTSQTADHQLHRRQGRHHRGAGRGHDADGRQPDHDPPVDLPRGGRQRRQRGR